MTQISDERHPEEHGHWDVADIRRLLFERDSLRRELQQRRAQDKSMGDSSKADAATSVAPDPRQNKGESPAQQAQPVAWMWESRFNRGLVWTACAPPDVEATIRPLYAAPPQDEARELLREASDELDYQTSNDHPMVAHIRAYLARTGGKEETK